ncbi:hypothetical protein ORJ04_19995 [Rheinheimera baltica]|uniref:Lipoprotein n=1 Tax=Rheinheimera baltica TaxID=67576 RepID=A0ABT9I4A9_9GAMM|nr:hypothetical protein [Rheinheimera baltica]MDP5138234.1 hypothetical protein [Rheinheimera baltica]
MRKFIFLCLIVVSLSSCASHQVAENGCKFVNGAHESEQERKKNNERKGEAHGQDKVDIINGILALFAINLSDEDKKCI